MYSFWVSDLSMVETLYQSVLEGALRELEPLEQEIFRVRLQQQWQDILRPFSHLYGHRDDCQQWLTYLVNVLAEMYAKRPSYLRTHDLALSHKPDWFQQSNMLGYVCYTDRFAGNLNGVIEKIPYLKELGVTYLHLMPLLKPREGQSDGGYAVQDYAQVNPQLGTMNDLSKLALALHQEGISLCIDLVCNHTAKEHDWAQQALAGDQNYQNYYLIFPDRTIPDQYEQTLREIFPDFAPGNFTYNEQIDKWVWTTFNDFQWDLNYANPAVFAEMLKTMLNLANRGASVLRLDAVAFMWKRLGTMCENLPEAHLILQAFRAFSRVAAPSLLLKAEAIVSPPDLIPYLGVGEGTNKECEIAYHNVLMVMLWSSLAERKVVLMTHALQQMPPISSGASWLTYIRCHDDIGWAVTEEDAAAVGLNGFAHRSFLSDFYTGNFPNSFARGGTFQFNPKNNDRRINGSLASLAGLEIALENNDEFGVELAIKRIVLLHAIALAYGGIPVLYMGDELGLLNDWSFQDDPVLAEDSRWLHRPKMDWSKVARREDDTCINGRIYQSIRHLITIRQSLFVLHAQAATEPVWMKNDHVFGCLRHSPRGRLLVLGNFTEHSQSISRHRLAELGFYGAVVDHLTGSLVDMRGDVILRPYQAMWLQVKDL